MQIAAYPGIRDWADSLDVDVRYDLLSLDDLQRITDDFVKQVNKTFKPKIDWKSFFQNLFEGIGKIDSDQKVRIDGLRYFKNVSLLFSTTPDEYLGNRCL